MAKKAQNGLLFEYDLPFSSEEFKAIWEEWLQYRKERQLPKYTNTGLKRTFTYLKDLCNEDEKKLIHYIIFSMSQSWQGIYKDPNYGQGLINASNSQGPGPNKPGTSQSRIDALRTWGRQKNVAPGPEGQDDNRM